MSDKTVGAQNQTHLYDGVFRYLQNLRTRAQLLRNAAFQKWATEIGLTQYLLSLQSTNALFSNAVYSTQCNENTEPEENDDLYSKIVKIPSLRIFREVAAFAQQAYQCNEKQTKQILHSFLELTPIKNQYSNTELFLEQALFEEELAKLQEYHLFDKKESYEDVMKEINQILDKVGILAEKIRKNPNQVCIIFSSYQKAIQNAYKDLRYTVGCLIGILDILQFPTENRIDSYFRNEHSVKKLYFFQCNPLKYSLKSLLVRYPKERSSSIRNLYEQVFFISPLGDSLPPTRGKMEVIQDQLDQQMWKFQRKGRIHSISLEDMKWNYLLIFRYLILFKCTLAGLCFDTKKDLRAYLSYEVPIFSPDIK